MLRSELEAGLMVRGNRELLGRMLVNLVDNALKYGVGERQAERCGDRAAGRRIESRSASPIAGRAFRRKIASA